MAALLKGIPVLPAGDLNQTLSFYKEKLGFSQTFQMDGYAGLKRDNVELHFTAVPADVAKVVAEQTMCRFNVKDVDGLYNEYQKHDGVIHPNGAIADKPWGSREFAVLDPSGVCLTFTHDA
ncbi:MAG: VOC family protein [Planctomycetes bacterium]|nr:VOC family protein [Planctomycetota bacterium]